ncbi:neprilysin-1-like [Pollicipes pollicipes]|uniref:neprilysin-1-like n=1 Tax=Pollicipes pollicipes TaxID=41117 RepID=UPI0018850C9E|nr:neprilysin-1-like [Pollicipes pollicipes]
MDRTADPCHDFFQFACGTYNKEHVIPEDRSSISTFEVLADHLQVTIKGLLEDPVVDVRDSNTTRKAKMFYSSCMNTSQIRLEGDRPLRRVLDELGGWPVLERGWQAPNTSLERLLGTMRSQYDQGVVLEMWVGPDDRNSSINIIQIDQMVLSLPSREYFVSDRYRRELDAYRSFMTEVAVLMGAEPLYAQAEMNRVLQLEIALSNASVPEADRQDTGAIYTRMPLHILTNSVPGFNWREYLQSLLHVPINGNEPVVVYSMPYIRAVGQVVMNTERRVIVNYIMWKLVKDTIQYMTPPYQKLLAKFRKVLLGIPSDRNRWNRCVEWTNKHFGMAVGALFIKKKFNHESKRTALEMIHTLREAFIELLEDNIWMDDATRAVAREKAMAMNEHIGYPEFLTRPAELDKEFQGIDVSNSSFLLNIFRMLKYKAQRNLSKLRKPVTKNKWSTEPPVVVVNAFYNPNKNDIVFPAGILQPLFYSQYFPKSLNYGGIGVVIGHEITHGFDDKGRQFDKNGNLKQWWDNATIQAFQKQTECIVKQYSSYRLEQIGRHVNGKMTRGENIADNGGLKQAFRAYRKWVTRNGEEDLLPGIDLTHDQLFFLNYAQIWCGSMRPEDAETKIMSSVHAPGPIRILGPLSNSEDFARSYRCPVGSRMNPSHKCTVW